MPLAVASFHDNLLIALIFVQMLDDQIEAFKSRLVNFSLFKIHTISVKNKVIILIVYHMLKIISIVCVFEK